MVYVNWPSYIPTPLKKQTSLYLVCKSASQLFATETQKRFNMLISFHEYTMLKAKKLSNIYEKKNTKQEDSDHTKEEDNSL